ncbi:hypothetical protein OG21DRAFT_1490407, partial [Imleria badia]
NWGGQTEAYYQSISNRKLETIGDIVAGALCLLATSTDRLQLLESTSEGEDALGSDP